MCVALGGIRLQVPQGEVELAKEILSSEIEQDESEVCPSCGSFDTALHKKNWKIAFLAVHLLSIPLPFSSRNRKCSNCNYVWSINDIGY